VNKRIVLNNLLESNEVFRASVPSSYRYVITQGLDFTLKELINARLNLNRDQSWPTMLGTHFLSGAAAGLTSFSILYPEDVVTNQYVVDKKTGRASPLPARDAIKSVWKTRGLRGFYYKYSWNAPAVAINKGLYFGVYDTIKYQIIDEEYRNWFSLCFLSGCVSTSLATIVPHPLLLASSTNDPKISYGAALKEVMRCFTNWKLPNLGIRTVRGALLLATFDKITSYVYTTNTTTKQKPRKKMPGDYDEKYQL
jgi:hypothetical protein